MPPKSSGTEGNTSASPARNCLWRIQPARPWRWPGLPIRKMPASLSSTYQRKSFHAFMRIDGLWHPCNDGELRPIIQARALAADGRWVSVRFLVDIGADLTVFSADTLEDLGLT